MKNTGLGHLHRREPWSPMPSATWSQYHAGEGDLAAGGVAICRELLPRLLEVAPGAVLVVVTNPVDVLT